MSDPVTADLNTIVEWRKCDPVLVHRSEHFGEAGCPGVADAGKAELLHEGSLLFIGSGLSVPGTGIHREELPLGDTERRKAGQSEKAAEEAIFHDL